MPDGSFVNYTTTYYYVGSYTPSGGAIFYGPTYYPNPPQPKVTTCGIAGSAWISSALQAAQSIINNPNQFLSLGSKFMGAGMTAGGVAGAFLEAGATVASSIAFILELAAVLTVGEWLLLATTVVGLAGLVYQAVACKVGD